MFPFNFFSCIRKFWLSFGEKTSHSEWARLYNNFLHFIRAERHREPGMKEP